MNSNFTKPELSTLDFYALRAAKFAASRKKGKEGFWYSELQRFHYYLPQGRVVEFGAGAGVEAGQLGTWYDYLGTDPVEEFLQIARRDNPGLVFRRASLYDDLSTNHPLDGFWCCATILHIPTTRLKTTLSRLRKGIRKGGVGFISIQAGEGEFQEKSLFAPDLPTRLFVYHSDKYFSQLLRQCSFGIIRTETKKAPGFTKTHEEVTWLSYYIRAV